jgi:glycerol-3-phosphate dehydrogenase
LPGGDLTPAYNAWLEELGRWVPPALLHRLSRAYGTRLERLIGGANALDGLGLHFGAGLHEAEVRYLIEFEFARTAEDILWRRTKLGLTMTARERAALERFVRG